MILREKVQILNMYCNAHIEYLSDYTVELLEMLENDLYEKEFDPEELDSIIYSCDLIRKNIEGISEQDILVLSELRQFCERIKDVTPLC